MKIIKSNSTYDIYDNSDITMMNNLEPKHIYTIKFSQQRGYFLQDSTLPDPPKKIYGELPNYAKYILNTFNDESKSVGVLLSGKPGQGKTMFAQIMHQISNLPIIKVGNTGASVTNLLEKIDKPTILLFDEYEKNFDDDDQKQMLSFFDGTSQNKFLSIITINDETKLNQYFKNRPSRMRYHIKPEIPNQTNTRLLLEDYLQDDLDNDMQSNINEIVTAQGFNQHSYDELTTIAKELKNGATLDMIQDILNIKTYMPNLDIYNKIVMPDPYAKIYNKLYDVIESKTRYDAYAFENSIQARNYTITTKHHLVTINDRQYITLDPTRIIGNCDTDDISFLATPGLQQESYDIIEQAMNQIDADQKLKDDILADVKRLHRIQADSSYLIPVQDLQSNKPIDPKRIKLAGQWVDPDTNPTPNIDLDKQPSYADLNGKTVKWTMIAKYM